MGSMILVRKLLLLSVFVSVVMLLIQMHLLDNHISSLSSPLSPLSISRSIRIHSSSNINDDDKEDTNDDDKEEGEEATDDDDKEDSIAEIKITEEDEEGLDPDLKPILKILRQGGYNISKDSDMIDRSLLPKWSEIVKAYGPPRILGLESCQKYRDTTKPRDRNIAPAGLFNSGTNLLSHLLLENCDFDDLQPQYGTGTFWQPIWGKHTPATYRTIANIGKKYTKSYETTLPILSIRDPYTWMQSMCRQNYGAQFDHNKETCPNIIPYPADMDAHPRYRKMKYVPVNAKFTLKYYKVHYDSLAHMWNEWYQTYMQFDDNGNDKGQDNDTNNKMKEPDFPFLVVRMEDLIFHAQTVVPQLCECAGAKYDGGDEGFQHIRWIANGNHGIDVSDRQSGLLRSVIKYGNFTNRRMGYPNFQLEAAKDILDPRMMEMLAYPYEESH